MICCVTTFYADKKMPSSGLGLYDVTNSDGQGVTNSDGQQITTQ